MSARVPLQMMSLNTPDPSMAMFNPYCHCCCSSSSSSFVSNENQPVWIDHSYPSSSIANYNPPEIEPLLSSDSFPIMDSKKKPIRRSKHIPHHLRPKHVVERRNTRERRRVQDVNRAFHLLKSLLPPDSHVSHDGEEIETTIPHPTRVSKVRTLRQAVDYIEALQTMLNQSTFIQ